MKCLGDFGQNYNDDNEMGFSFKLPSVKLPSIRLPVKLPSVTVKLPTTINAVIRDLGKVTGEGMRIANPLNQIKATWTKIPVLKDIYRETDKFLGGTITSLTNVSNLTSKVLSGKGISQAELLEAVMVAAQVGAIVASGGSAAAFIGAGAGALRKGPLGQSEFGRNLLTFAEIAGNAAALSGAAGSQLAQQAGKDVAMDAAQKAVKDKAMSMAQTAAEKEFQKRTGIPVALATNLYNVSTGQPFTAKTTKDILKVVAEDQLKKAGLSDSVTQAILSNNAAQLGVAIRNAPNLAIDAAKREIEAQKIKLASAANLENIKKKIEMKAEKALKDATDADAIRKKIEVELNAQAKKILEQQLASIMSGLLQNQKEIVAIGEEYQIESAQASVMIAAAEEGRYESTNKVLLIGGGIVVASVAAYFIIQRSKQYNKGKS